MFGIERYENGEWLRVWTYDGFPLVYDYWAVKYATEFAAELDRATGQEHRLCVIGESARATKRENFEAACVAAYVAEGLGEN